MRIMYIWNNLKNVCLTLKNWDWDRSRNTENFLRASRKAWNRRKRWVFWNNNRNRNSHRACITWVLCTSTKNSRVACSEKFEKECRQPTDWSSSPYQGTSKARNVLFPSDSKLPRLHDYWLHICSRNL